MPNKSIHTETVSRGVARATAFELFRSPHTIVRFEPTIHGSGVKGRLVKYKKSPNRDWNDLKTTDFNNHPLGSMEKVIVDLKTETVTLLLEELNSLKLIADQGVQGGHKEYLVAEKDKAIVVNDKNKMGILQQILKEGLSDEYWQLLASSQPDLADRLAAGHIQHTRAQTISELKTRLTGTFPETKGPQSWQNWIYDNHWLFGVNYQRPIEKQKVNLPGVMPDYLFPRIDGFVDLLEIKLPTVNVISPDPSHPGAFRWSADTTKAIGQVVYYLGEIERQQLEIEQHIRRQHHRSVSMLRPQAYILIGNSENWTPEERNGLRKLNHSLHGVEVLTYQELIYRGEAFLAQPVAVLESIPPDEIPF